MPLKFTIHRKIDELNVDDSFSGEFTDQEYTILREFISCSDTLMNTQFIKKKDFGSLQLKSNENGQLSVEVTLPDWDDVCVFLHKLRPLILTDEKTYFNKVKNLVSSKFRDEFWQGFFDLQKEAFNSKRNQGLVQIKSNEEILNSEKMLFTWLNAHEYHREIDKQKFLEDLHHILPLDASKVLFLRLLIDKVEAIRNLTDLIKVVLGMETEASILSRHR